MGGLEMTSEFQQTLQKYAELTVKMGLNLQPGQRLLIIGPMANVGISLQARRWSG
jgi:leucyl aminopeptidase (aminopeptidase T)